MQNQDLLRVSEPYLGKNANTYITDVLESGWLSPGGKYCRQLRHLVSEANNGCHVVLTNSGTSALEVAIAALARVRRLNGGTVVVPAYTCPDCAMAVLKAGFKVSVADVDPVRLGITPESLEAVVTPDCVGVMLVHIYGMGVDRKVYEVARKHGLFVVDDAAEAYGIRIDGLSTLELADVVCTSLRGDKTVPVGTGGLVMTRHEGIAGIAAGLVGLNSCGGMGRYRTHDSCLSYEYPELLAALACAQLEDYDAVVTKRWDVVYWYVRAGLSSPFRPGDVPWKMPVRVPDAEEAIFRLAQAGIEASPPFQPLPRLGFGTQPVPRQGYGTPPLPVVVAEQCANSVIGLPLHPKLTVSQVTKIVEALQ